MSEQQVRDDQRISDLLSRANDDLADRRFDDAADAVRQILSLDWNEPAAFDMLGVIARERQQRIDADIAAGDRHFAAGNFRRAALRYARAAKFDTANVTLRDRLAEARTKSRVASIVEGGLKLFIAEDYGGALRRFDRALALDPRDKAAAGYRDRVRRVLAERDAGTLDDIRANTDDWRTYTEALAHFRANELDDAERLWRDLLTRYPNNKDILSNLEQLDLRREDSNDRADAGQRP